jgi:hypothetical protein
MALHIHFASSSFTNKPYHHLPQTPLFHSPTKPKHSVNSQNPSESQKPTTNLDETASAATPPKKTGSSGLGFGSSSPSRPSSKPNPRASIIRRSPVEKPSAVVSQEDKVKE